MSVVTELRREISETVESLDIVWPSKDDVIWFDDISSHQAEHLCISARRGAGGSGSVPNAPRSVQKLLNLYTRLCNIARNCYHTGPSRPEPLWGKDAGPKWPKQVKKETSLWISSGDILSKDYVKKCVEEMVNEIDNLWRDECLIVHGFPILFELNIYVLYLIGTLFTKVGLVRPQGPNATVLLYKFISWDLTTKKLLGNILQEMVATDPLQLHISGGIQFFESDFYLATVDMSYVHLNESICDVLENVERSRTHSDSHGSDVTNDIGDRGRNDDSVLLNHSMEVELANMFLNQTDLPYPCGQEGVVWLGFPRKSSKYLSLVRKRSSSTVPFDISHSKFCFNPLLNCHRKLCRILKENCRVNFTFPNATVPLPNTSAGKHPWFNLFSSACSLDFGMQSWIEMESCVDKQLSMLQKIISCLEDLHKSENLVMKSYLLLSEFNVSVVFHLGFLFEKVGLFIPVPDEVEDTVILFYNFQEFDRNIKSHLEEALLENNLLSLVSLSYISDGDFYTNIKDINNICLKQQANHILHCIEEMEE